MQKFCSDVSKELAARLLRLVIKITPIGNYEGGTYVCAPGFVGRAHSGTTVPGKKGGTLRRGWTARTEAEAAGGGNVDVTAYANALPVSRRGDTYIIEVINPVHYASYVEFGHRTRGGGWVDGHYFMTVSEQELEKLAPGVIERRLERLLMQIFSQ